MMILSKKQLIVSFGIAFLLALSPFTIFAYTDTLSEQLDSGHSALFEGKAWFQRLPVGIVGEPTTLNVYMSNSDGTTTSVRGFINVCTVEADYQASYRLQNATNSCTQEYLASIQNISPYASTTKTLVSVDFSGWGERFDPLKFYGIGFSPQTGGLQTTYYGSDDVASLSGVDPYGFYVPELNYTIKQAYFQLIGEKLPSDILNDLDCSDASFCWYWFDPLMNTYLSGDVYGYCGTCEGTTCGVDVYSCGACLNEIDCNASLSGSGGINLCDWDSVHADCRLNNSNVCAEGYQFKYCFTEATCLAVNGFWDSDFLRCGWEQEATTTDPFTDPDFGLFGNWLFDGLKWLFLPNMDMVKDTFFNYVDIIKTRFPFGYFTYISDIVQDKLTDESGNATTTYPVYSIEFSGHSYEFIDMDTINDNVPEFFTMIRTLITVFLWGSCAYYIYARIKDSNVGL